MTNVHDDEFPMPGNTRAGLIETSVRGTLNRDEIRSVASCPRAGAGYCSTCRTRLKAVAHDFMDCFSHIHLHKPTREEMIDEAVRRTMRFAPWARMTARLYLLGTHRARDYGAPFDLGVNKFNFMVRSEFTRL